MDGWIARMRTKERLTNKTWMDRMHIRGVRRDNF